MYLQQPRGHVRQRSTGTEVYTEIRAVQELQVVESLLDEVEFNGQSNITYRFGQTRWSDTTFGVLWIISLGVVALGTFALTIRSENHALGSFDRGYGTDLGTAYRWFITTDKMRSGFFTDAGRPSR